MLNLLNHLLGREFSMAGRRPGANADQACDFSHLQPYAAEKQEVADDPRTGIIPVTVLEELKCCLEDCTLLIIQPIGRHLRRLQPLLKCLTFLGHGIASLVVSRYCGSTAAGRRKPNANPE